MRALHLLQEDGEEMESGEDSDAEEYEDIDTGMSRSYDFYQLAFSHQRSK